MNKAVLFVDTDFISDLYGRAKFNAATGNEALDELSKIYDIRLTSTVAAELQAGTINNRYQWFSNNNIVPYPTPEYDDLRVSGISDAGERSIAAVVDPNYIDEALGRTIYHNSSLPNISDTENLRIASRDQTFFQNQPINNNVRSTQNVIEDALVKGNFSPDTYNAFFNNNNGKLGASTIKTAKKAVVDYGISQGVDITLDAAGEIRLKGVLTTVGELVGKKTPFIGTVLAFSIAYAQSAEAAENNDMDAAANVWGEFGVSALSDWAVGGAAFAAAYNSPILKAIGLAGGYGKIAQVTLSALVGIGVAIGADAVAQRAFDEFISAGQKFGLLPADGFFDRLVDDYAWAFDNPSAIFEELPAPIQDLLARLLGAEAQASPLVLDLDGDGVELTATGAAGSVYFDLDNDGFGEATGWVRGGDGLLALDRNGNGVIDDKSELFGDTATAVNGFESLKTLDSNLDGRITSADQKFAQLRVWIDANADGISQSSELKTLSSLGITAINTGYTDVSKTNAGHAVLQEGTFTRNGVTRQIADVWFSADQTNAEYLKDYTLDVRTLFLPTLRGYGNLADLHIAMSMDNTAAGNLLGRVMAIAGKDMTALFSSATFFDDMRAILHRWAGVDGIAPTSRGINVDARDLAFIEKLSGEPFLQLGYLSNPRYNAGKDITDAFEYALNAFAARIALQAAGGGLFRGQEVYDGAKDTFGTLGALDSAALNTLGAQAKTMTAANAKILWENVLRVVIGVKGEAAITLSERTLLDNAIKASQATLSFNAVRDSIFADNRAGAFLSGTAGNDTINGTTKDDSISGLAGNDTINGGLGGDTLDGGQGNDRLTGGTGDDLLLGGEGVDTYIYNRGDGNDTIREAVRSSLGDVILFGSGISASNLTITRVSNKDMKIAINAAGGGGEIIIENQFDDSSGAVELLQFADGTTMNLTVMNFTLQGQAGDDILNGLGGSAKDIIYGLDGNDTIYGYTGEDTLYGGNGNDIIYGGGASSTHYSETTSNRLYGEAGDDRIYGSYGIDYIYGGRGNDYMAGSQGNDNYYFDLKGGNDTIKEVGTGTDVIYMGAGIAASNLSYIRDGNFNLKIMVNGGFDGNIILEGQFATGSANGAVEFVQLSTGQRIDLRTLNYGLFGTAANDTLIGTPGAGIDTISGAGGNDTIYGYLGEDLLFGGDSDDIIHGGGPTSTYSRETTSNRLFGDAGNDQIFGSDGIDHIYGGLGDDTLSGRSGADTYYFRRGWGNDTINEISDDIDTLIFDETIALSDIAFARIGSSDLKIFVNEGYGGSIVIKNQFSTSSNNYTFEMLVFSNGQTVDLRALGYTLRGTAASETLVGTYKNSNGQDTIYGEGGDDTIHGYQGNDTLYGGAGNDIIYGGNNTSAYARETSTNRLYGDSGNDSLYGAYGVDHLYGGTGNDRVQGSRGADRYYFDLNGGADTIDEVESDLDTIVFGSGISSSSISYVRIGTSDLQILINNGAGGSITILDQYASSTAAFGAVEFISFSNGTQIDLRTLGYTMRGTALGETLVGTQVHSNGQDIIYGDGGNDTIYGYLGDDTLYGGEGDDIIYGGGPTSAHSKETSTNRIYGDAGNDTLYGTYGVDYLYGGAGNDTLSGNRGNDFLYGDAGANILTGGIGRDTFFFMKETAFDTVDQITDFKTSEGDKINIANLLQGYNPATQSITGFVEITTVGSDSILKVDANGGANSFVQVATIKGVTGLTDEAALVASGNLVVV